MIRTPQNFTLESPSIRASAFGYINVDNSPELSDKRRAALFNLLGYLPLVGAVIGVVRLIAQHHQRAENSEFQSKCCSARAGSFTNDKRAILYFCEVREMSETLRGKLEIVGGLTGLGLILLPIIDLAARILYTVETPAGDHSINMTHQN